MPRIENNDKCPSNSISAYSWSGERKMPSYLNRLVFPEDFLTALRTIAMKDDELYKVTSLLTELVGPGGQRQPSDAEVRAAIWEACGDSGALQVLVDLLNMK
nr:ribulose-1,5 bisphosphate carboxylase/oxygenase large subunit N-methyltransferase, chloroplastic isoform X2 [Ipomoea batatas]